MAKRMLPNTQGHERAAQETASPGDVQGEVCRKKGGQKKARVLEFRVERVGQEPRSGHF